MILKKVKTKLMEGYHVNYKLVIKLNISSFLKFLINIKIL
jgi:hypothetical protein